MPSAEAIIYAAVSGLIVILLTIIGALVKMGFDGIKSEIQKLRDELRNFHTEITALRERLAAIEANCVAIHGGHSHRRATDD